MTDHSHNRSSLKPSQSVIIPAYNEATRLESTLEIVHTYLVDQDFDFEIIVVNDGSTDETREISERVAKQNESIRVLDLPHGGKAVAVRRGIEATRGDVIAFTDADLATPIDALVAFRTAIENGYDLAIGSREGVGAKRIGEPLFRHVMGRAFNLMVRALVLPGIQDSQCGFKLFSREAAETILANLRLYSATEAPQSREPKVTAFDVELLVVARRQGLRIAVIPVTWTFGENSKVNPLRDTVNNTRDVLTVKWHDLRGRYD